MRSACGIGDAGRSVQPPIMDCRRPIVKWPSARLPKCTFRPAPRGHEHRGTAAAQTLAAFRLRACPPTFYTGEPTTLRPASPHSLDQCGRLLMPIDLAIVPVAGRGTRLLAPDQEPAQGNAPGRLASRWCSTWSRSWPAAASSRLLFITGPGKTAIENHFDIDAELIDEPPRDGQGRAAGGAGLRAATTSNTSTRASGGNSAWATPCSAPGRSSADQPFVVALGDSIIGLQRRDRRGPHDDRGRSRRTGADGVVALEEVPREEVVHYGIAKPRGTGRRGFRAGRPRRKARRRPRPRATWPSPPATSSARRSSTASNGPRRARAAKSN